MDERYQSRDDLLQEIERLKRRLAELDAVEAKRDLAVTELETQSKILRKVLDTMPGGVVVVDEKGELVLFNPAAERLLGLGLDEPQPPAKTAAFGMFRDERSTPMPAEGLPLTRALRGDNVDSAEVFVRNVALPDGLWLSGAARPLRDDKGAIRGAVGSFIDITARRRAERALRMVLEATREIATAATLDEALEAVVRSVCESTGWSYGEAWRPLPDGSALEASHAWHGDDPRLQKFRAASRALTFPQGVGMPGRVWQTKRPLWIPDIRAGAKAIFGRVELATELGLRSSAGVPIVLDGEVLAVLAFYSFDSRRADEEWVEQVSHLAMQLAAVIGAKRGEEALRTAREATQAAERLTFSTVSSINHEMRQHVAAIVGFSDLIKETPLTAKQMEYLEMIRRSADEQVEILKKEMQNAPPRG